MKGTIFDIKELSIHDGPGCRVTVFMKGCPLRCIWCHNPEGLDPKRQLMVKHNLCVRCGSCLAPCDHEECRPFGRCIHRCPNGCLSVTGEDVTSEALAERLLCYKPFFDAADGGVTISGGEPLMQHEFVCELVDRLDGVHKALQTSGFAAPEVYKKTVEKFDFVMQDIKLADCDEHKRYTGVSNDLILKNIEYLKSGGRDFVFRVPLIPQITDTEKNLRMISEIVGDSRVELLRYNQIAGAKYEMLGYEYRLDKDIKNTGSDYVKYFENAISVN